MRDVERGAQHVADAVARPHRHAAGERRHRQPRADLAIEPRLQVVGVGLDPRQAAAQQRQPVQRLRVGVRVGLVRAKPSTQWSTARIPVDRNSHSGVCTVMAGSRITAPGMMPGWRNSSLTRTRSSVTPEIALNSPADNVVGTVTWPTVGALPAGPGRIQASSASAVRMSLARHSRTALAPSVTEPPPSVTIRSAEASRAIAAASITAPRGVCGGIRSNCPARRLPSARRKLVDLVGRAVERAADHQEDPAGSPPRRLLGDRLGRRPAKLHRFHRAKGDAAFPQHGSSSLAGG